MRQPRRRPPCYRYTFVKLVWWATIVVMAAVRIENRWIGNLLIGYAICSALVLNLSDLLRVRWVEVDARRLTNVARAARVMPNPPAYATAEDVARQLFERLLTTEQWAEWRATGKVSVPLPGSDKPAEIGKPGLKIIWPDGKLQCVMPVKDDNFDGFIPAGDILFAQLLHLRNNPNALRKIAYLSQIYPRPRFKLASWLRLDT